MYNKPKRIIVYFGLGTLLFPNVGGDFGRLGRLDKFDFQSGIVSELYPVVGLHCDMFT
jgi:hypothetical protein